MPQRRFVLKSLATTAMVGLSLPQAMSKETVPALKDITVFHTFEPSPYDVLSNVINQELAKKLGVSVHFEYGLMGRADREVYNGPTDGSRIYFAALGPMVLKPIKNPTHILRPTSRPSVAPPGYRSFS